MFSIIKLNNKKVTGKIQLNTETMPDRSHKKSYSPEIWAVKLRFLLIYENMLKSIATARSECTAKPKYENKVSYNTDYLVTDLIDFFGDA